MTESLLRRMMRRLRAGTEAVVRAIKDLAPERAREDTLRELDLTVAQGRDELGKCVAAAHMASKRLSALQAKQDELTEQAQRAVMQGREDLARAAVSQQLEVETQVAVLAQQVQEARALERRLEKCLRALLEARAELMSPDPADAGADRTWGDRPLAPTARGLYGATHEERVQDRLRALKVPRKPKRDG